MRDLKQTLKTTKRVQLNRRKQKKKPLAWRKLLHRTLRVGVTIFSAVLLLVGGFFVTQLLLASDLFRVDNVVVQGSSHLKKQQVVALSDIEMGVNTFNLDLGLIGRKIEENPWVDDARVQRIFPRQVMIHIKERQPVAIVNLGFLYYLDDQGVIFKVLDATDNLDYPVVTGFDYAKAQSHKAEYAQQLRGVVGLLSNLSQRDLFSLDQISEVHFEADGGLSLYTLKGGVKIKLGSADYDRKLDRLERIYAELQPKLPLLDYIDLQVEEKVIVRIERSKQMAKS
ncbi:MAG: cell division protein FtsQ/DivIB [Desulfuromusa sp.]|nr:cell division protein FtsQ/DivIB [Desulfuromusa sp.]